MRLPILAVCGLGALSCTGPDGPPAVASSTIFVQGVGVTNTDCRSDYCQHNENTDLVAWDKAIYLVHRTAQSQVLGPDSALHIYRSADNGKSFEQTAVVLAPAPGELGSPNGRDLRDPHFYVVGNQLYIKAITRLPVLSSRDSNVQSICVETHTADGVNWTPLNPIGPTGWSFWRIKERAGTYYTAAYEDGDLAISLFSSADGLTWTRGADVYTNSAATPVETELTFMPSGRLLALVRTDGTDAQLLGTEEVTTQVCWAQAPYSSFDCSETLKGVRLDGPVSYFHHDRLFVVARKHLGPSEKKRTAVYEITGTLDGGPIDIKEWAVLPSAGDTSYAGVVALPSDDTLVSWYSGDIPADEPWLLGMLDASNIWLGTFSYDTQ